MLSALQGFTGKIELTRLVGASAALIYPFPYLWDVIAKGVVPDPSSFGTGYALVLGAIGVMIGAKDIGAAKAVATMQGTSNA
jgi:hypothetical protein